ncbi:MAG: gluconokinase [Burkholderiales bacterium RIFCSPLOWO2_02_FULL_57_36]|nr:MAG: gluconokinase [Burkholderiales bacterium RIFCSPLOWO2_02_FULL_57_36]
MGVSGCGKSEIGRRLARRLGLAYIEGDEHHSPESISRMAAGMPLTDDDRHEWLLTLQSLVRRAAQRNQGLVLTCSALKRRYRDMLRAGDPALEFIHLHGDPALIAARMKQRTGHFMPAELLESQLRDLEPLAADQRAIRIDIDAEPDAIVDQIVQKIAAV